MRIKKIQHTFKSYYEKKAPASNMDYMVRIWSCCVPHGFVVDHRCQYKVYTLLLTLSQSEEMMAKSQNYRFISS